MPVQIWSTGGGSGKGYSISSVKNLTLSPGNGKVTIKWFDPDDTATILSITASESTSGLYVQSGIVRDNGSGAIYSIDNDGNITYSSAAGAPSKTIVNVSEKIYGVSYFLVTDVESAISNGSSKRTVTCKKYNIEKEVDDRWIGTKVIRKTGSYPSSIKDGVLVVDSKVKNQYALTGYEDSGVMNGTEYFYSVFAYSKSSFSIPVSASATPMSFKSVLKENSWEQISKASEMGIAKDLWHVGDEIDVSFGSSGTYTFQIYGFGIDDKADGTGKAGITFGMKNLMNETKRMKSSNSNDGSWEVTEMRNTTIAGFWNGMQSDVKAVVKTVNKITAASYNGSSLQTTADNLFLFAEKEVDSIHYSINAEKNALQTYPIFTDNNSRIKKMNNGSWEARHWWLRSPSSSGVNYFCNVFADGSAGNGAEASQGLGVALGFCV